MQVCLYIEYGVARVCNLDKFVSLMKLSLVRLSLSYINKSHVYSASTFYFPIFLFSVYTVNLENDTLHFSHYPLLFVSKSTFLWMQETHFIFKTVYIIQCVPKNIFIEVATGNIMAAQLFKAIMSK